MTNDKLLRDNVIAPSSLEASKQCILDWFSAKKRMRPIIIGVSSLFMFLQMNLALKNWSLVDCFVVTIWRIITDDCILMLISQTLSSGCCGCLQKQSCQIPWIPIRLD